MFGLQFPTEVRHTSPSLKTSWTATYIRIYRKAISCHSSRACSQTDTALSRTMTRDMFHGSLWRGWMLLESTTGLRLGESWLQPHRKCVASDEKLHQETCETDNESGEEERICQRLKAPLIILCVINVINIVHKMAYTRRGHYIIIRFKMWFIIKIILLNK